MNDIIVKYLQQPSNEGKLLGLFVLTKKYEYLLNHNTKENQTHLIQYHNEFHLFYKSIGPTFFINYFQFLETENENASIAQTLLTILQLFIHSSEVIESTQSYSICFSLISRLLQQPELIHSKSSVLNIIGKLLENSHLKKSKRLYQLLPSVYSKLTNCELLNCYGTLFTYTEYSSFIIQCLSKVDLNVFIELLPSIDIEKLNINQKHWIISYSGKLLKMKLKEKQIQIILQCVSKCIKCSKDWLSIKPIELMKVIAVRCSVEIQSYLLIESTVEKQSNQLKELKQNQINQIISIIESIRILINHTIRFNRDDEDENRIIDHSQIDIDKLGSIHLDLFSTFVNIHEEIVGYLQSLCAYQQLIQFILENQELSCFILNLFQFSS